MDRASQKLPAGALVGAVLLAVGAALPHSAARASAAADGVGLLTPGVGCGPAETLVGAGAPGLLARVRADAAAVAPRRLREAAPPGRPGARAKARLPAVAAAPRSVKKAPQAEQESRTPVLRSFYTCNAASAPNLAEGTGWRLVGPLRHS